MTGSNLLEKSTEKEPMFLDRKFNYWETTYLIIYWVHKFGDWLGNIKGEVKGIFRDITGNIL